MFCFSLVIMFHLAGKRGCNPDPTTQHTTSQSSPHRQCTVEHNEFRNIYSRSDPMRLFSVRYRPQESYQTAQIRPRHEALFM